MTSTAKKATKWLVVALSLGGIAFGVQRYLHSRKPVGPHYTTVKVDRGRIASHVTATGTLSALVTVLVGSQVSGRIDKINVDFNSPVKKNQVIAKIDEQLFVAAVQQAHANFLAAKANLEKAKAQSADADRQYQRNKALGVEHLVAQADIDTSQANADAAKAAVDAAAAGVDQAVANLNQADVNLKYCTIYSPIDGVVISRAVDVGQTVAASLAAPTLFTIAQDLTKMQVDTSVAEGDVGKIQPQMKVTFTVDAYPGHNFDGVVRQVRDAATTVQNVVTYDAVIDVDNDKRLLKPGMTATVTFTPQEREDVLRVANAALRFRPEGAPAGSASSGHGHAWAGGSGRASASGSGAPPHDSGSPAGSGSAWASASGAGSGSGRIPGMPRTDKKTVWKLDGGQPVAVNLRAGLSDGSVTEIVSVLNGSELKEGDEVITEEIGENGTAPPATQDRPARLPRL